VAIASHDQFMEQYHNALCREILAYQEGEKQHLATIFLGGGTPSTYPDNLLLDMVGILKERFSFDEHTEVTIEVNPGTVHEGQLAVWQKAGINRLSIGVQSLKDGVLQNLNRHQTAEDVLLLLQKAQHLFDNISVDLILGLPGVSADEWKDLLRTVVTWPIKHLSMYFLTVHEDTPLFFRVKKKAIVLPPDDEMVDLYYWSGEFLASQGFEQYELSNFARPGHESKHNSAYWDRKPYKAFGLGAHSFDGKRRFANEKNLMKYMALASEDKNVGVFAEELTPSQEHLERLMLGLRRAGGLSWDIILGGTPPHAQEAIKNQIEEFKRNHYLKETNNRLQLTPQGLVLENDIIARLSLFS
jgi:oxygen-independent coproporphyrinogen-3 oxidase